MWLGFERKIVQPRRAQFRVDQGQKEGRARDWQSEEANPGFGTGVAQSRIGKDVQGQPDSQSAGWLQLLPIDKFFYDLRGKHKI